MKVRLEDSDSPVIQAGPLVDCVFLMLIFFIVIAVTKKSVKELGIQLPVSGAAADDVKPMDRDLVIRVTQDGTVYVGEAEVQKQGLLDTIRQAGSTNPDTKVRLELDQRARVKHLMPIWDSLIDHGLTNWGIRTTADE